MTVQNSGAGDQPVKAVPDSSQVALHNLLAQLQGVPGLNVQRGIATLSGKSEKYVALLRQFVTSHAGDIALLAEQLACGEDETAMRQAHSLKGAAATLGFDALAERARQIEFHLKGLPEASAVSCQSEMEAIRQHMQALGAVLSAPSFQALSLQDDSLSAPTTEALRKLLDQIDALLAISDIKAVSFFQENASAFRVALGNNFDCFAQQIRQFDFQSAQQTLKSIG